MAEANTLSDQSPTKSTVAGVVKREGKKGRLRTTSKVRFPEDVHEPDILVSRENNGAIDINVGFLLSQHKYEASFTIEDSIKDDIEVPTDQQILLRVRNIYTSQNGCGHDIVMEIHAHKEGVWSEQIQLSSKLDNNNKVILVVHARVMDKEQGHPLLKEGIHCLGLLNPIAEAGSASEDSDWKGFE
ncbi:adipose-secreted signaling protein-like isoform X1 [Antedon mediterranea]|uniref:adipose-secreted signaling protein-like isoform X1 n=1 Tax=Antedon mediterranea TaxID=105859 RepID=UPI003AF5CDF5